MKYRADIDGLRAISVLSVILFHLGFSFFSGGFVGVDIFFVISGYLITSLVYEEIKEKKFSYISFYKRRIARLFPALIITLFMVFIFGFIFYDNKAFDNLGKEIFFSALGGANILFAQGVNYFAQGESVRPLIHLWSLGVEEQFYIVWPTLLILLSYMRFKNLFFSVIIVAIGLLFLSEYEANIDKMIAYFHPQYRAYELILGALAALYLKGNFLSNFDKYKMEFVSFISFLMMIVPIYMLDKNSIFPGLNALYPTLGATLFIIFAKDSFIAKFISNPLFVFIGLISYPLYLYHQPIISYIEFFGISEDKYTILLITLLISVPLAWITYRYIEQPIRKAAHTNKNSSKAYIFLVSMILFIAFTGIYVAKHDGISWRFKYLNHFAYELSQKSATSFHENFKKGYDISDKNDTKILFIGDSVLQQYAYPIMKAMKLDKKDVDTVTFGGCNLLKGIDFKEKFTGVSCNGLREKLYKVDKHYKYIFLSQQWSIYADQITNFDKSKKDSIEKWDPFIKKTLKHFLNMADHIVLIGTHISVLGTKELKPTIFLSKNIYLEKLKNLKVENEDKMKKNRNFFDSFKSDKILVIHPIDIWKNGKNSYVLSDENWSYFSDHMHASAAANGYLIDVFKNSLEQIKY